MNKRIRQTNKDREKSWAGQSLASGGPAGVDMQMYPGGSSVVFNASSTDEVLGQSLLAGSIDFPMSPTCSKSSSRGNTSSCGDIPIRERFEKLQSTNLLEVTNADREIKHIEMSVDAKTIQQPMKGKRNNSFKSKTPGSSNAMQPLGIMPPQSLNYTGLASGSQTPYTFHLAAEDYSSLALPPLTPMNTVSRDATGNNVDSLPPLMGEDFQVQVLAKRLLERSSDSKKRLPVSQSRGLDSHHLPVYFRNVGEKEMDSARSQGELSNASSEDGVLMRAYAAALGMSVDESTKYDDFSNPAYDGVGEGESGYGAIEEQLSDLVSSLQSARQQMQVSSRNGGRRSEDNEGVNGPHSSVESGTATPVLNPLTDFDIENGQESEEEAAISGRMRVNSIVQDGGDSSAGDALQLKQDIIGFDFNDGFDDDDDEEMDNEMREIMRSSRRSSGRYASTNSASSSGKKAANSVVRALSASYSTNAVLRGARADAKKGMRSTHAAPQRAKICTSPLRTSIGRKNSGKPALLLGGEKLPDIGAVSLKRPSKKGGKMEECKRNPRGPLSASASDSVLKRDVGAVGMGRGQSGHVNRPIVDMSKSLSILSSTS